MTRLLLAVAALWASSASAQLTNPDIHAGFPSYAYCHYQDLEYAATGSGLSTSGDQFFNSSTTSTLVDAPTSPPAMPNGVLAVGSVAQSLSAVGDAGVRTQPLMMSMGIGQVEFYYTGRELVLSTAGDDFTERVGILNNDTGPTNGVYFSYNHGVNSGKWLANAVSAGGGAATTADTGVTYAINTSRSFYILVDATAANAYFYINGALVATISVAADIPDGAEYTGMGWTAQKTASAGTVIPMTLDYIAGRITFTTPRC